MKFEMKLIGFARWPLEKQTDSDIDSDAHRLPPSFLTPLFTDSLG